MHRSRFLLAILSVSLTTAMTTASWALSFTSIIAEKGEPIHEKKTWPEGVSQLLKHETRGTGWNDWFSGWPNDVDHYEFQVSSMEEVNDVIRQFAQIKVSEGRPRPEIHLCPAASPKGFGWTTTLPADRKFPMIFALGDQAQLDRWYDSLIKRNGGKFGVMQFEEAPVAVPPTLTLFVGEPLIELDKLELPKTVLVREAGLPGNWHSAKLTVTKKEQPEGSKTEGAAVSKKELSPDDEKQNAWRESIRALIQLHNAP